MELNAIIYGDYFFKMIKLIECLNREQIEICSKTLNELERYYENLPEGFGFKTLGAATYLHFPEDTGEKYNRIKNKINPILMKNFRWLYDILIIKISEELKEECVISEDINLAFPGFHIFYPHEKCEYVSNPAHLDYQWMDHLDRLKQQFNDVDDNKFLTFTLSIKLPKNGAGLYYWDLPDYNKQYSFIEAEKIVGHILGEANNIFATYGDYVPREQYEKVTTPSVLKYKEGYMTIFTQPILHQIMPFTTGWLPEDKRITLQGHGIKCDDIWRLYF